MGLLAAAAKALADAVFVIFLISASRPMAESRFLWCPESEW
jgi:hypothetical protein